MKTNQLPALPLAEVSPQERLAYAWAVVQSNFENSPSVSERLLDRCRFAAYKLSDADAWDLLADVPSLA